MFTDNDDVLAMCRERYKTVLLPQQMASDGSFPRELARTKPYAYSIFVLDNMVTLCQLLSAPSDDLWSFRLLDGRGISLGLDFLYPFLADRSSWPYPPDWSISKAGRSGCRSCCTPDWLSMTSGI
ncbi:alginate lyase family protein [Paenibacillus alkalitolerans]|uniref:alginate lyase family protein n=1 Tax=Paenibacillus alkalitolerans TaxID=2799335 RepID=UPI0018F47A8E|nr:alginate lyase family protein [Paenibacillus alkalitolerans]